MPGQRMACVLVAIRIPAGFTASLVSMMQPD